MLKTIYVHPAVIKRIRSGNISPVITRYEGLDVGDVVEVCDDDEVNSVITKVARVEARGSGLYRLELKDPATAFVE